jgi:hypothetical protein
MRKGCLAGLAALLVCADQIAAAPTGNLLESSKPWVLDYGETQCSAMREYVDSARPVTFAIVPSPDGQTYELLVVREQDGPSYAKELEGSIDFGSGPIKSWLLEYAGKKGRVRLYQFRVSAEQMAEARNARSVRVHMDGAADHSFALDTMPALMDAMEKCTADLKAYWNAEGEQNGQIAVPVKGDVRADFSASDYPQEAVDRMQSGSAKYLLLINEKGDVAACHVLVPSGVPVLDAMGCAVIQSRSKFRPAKNSAGKPVRSTYVTPMVKWQIEG